MDNGLNALEELHAKTVDLLEEFKDLPPKDIRINHLKIISGIVAVSLVNLRINIKFSDSSRQDFAELFNNDQIQIHNYIHNFIQVINDSIIENVLFQTELIFRVYYSKLTGRTLADKASIPKMVATLFEDVENNWAKNEAAIVPLFWTLRNTIHTGGIYFDKVEGRTINYKGKEYKFEYGKAPEFLKQGHSIFMVSELLDSINYLFKSDLIKNLGSFEHPSFYALGHSDEVG